MHLTTSPAISSAPGRPPLEQVALAAAPRLEAAAHFVSRWGLVAILLALGAFKFTAVEAADIKPMVENSPLLGFLYRVTSVQGASNVIGVVELATAALLAAHRWSPRAAALGGLGALLTFATTLSFLVTTPGLAGRPDMLGFLLKDVFLFGAALTAAAASLRSLAEGRSRMPGLGRPGAGSTMGATAGEKAERGDEAWVEQLRAAGPAGEAARRDLRALLVAGLGRAFAARAGAQIEDFAQEALLRVLDQIDAYRGDSRFTTWAMSVAVRVAYSELRRARWKDLSFDALVAPDGACEAGPEAAHDAERALARGRALSALEVALDGLTERQRTVIVAELRGMPQDEIGRRLGVNRNAVYKLGHDARRSLLRALVTEGFCADDIAWAFAEERGADP